jgi:hypothetical protein
MHAWKCGRLWGAMRGWLGCSFVGLADGVELGWEARRPHQPCPCDVPTCFAPPFLHKPRPLRPAQVALWRPPLQPIPGVAALHCPGAGRRAAAHAGGSSGGLASRRRPPALQLILWGNSRGSSRPVTASAGGPAAARGGGAPAGGGGAPAGRLPSVCRGGGQRGAQDRRHAVARALCRRRLPGPHVPGPAAGGEAAGAGRYRTMHGWTRPHSRLPAHAVGTLLDSQPASTVEGRRQAGTGAAWPVTHQPPSPASSPTPLLQTLF